jgi:signal transduction histidine kinase
MQQWRSSVSDAVAGQFMRADTTRHNGFDARNPHVHRDFLVGSAAKRVSAREEERRKIAHELHDAFGQDLVAVLLEMNRLAATCKTKTADTRQSLSEEICGVLENLSARVGKIATSLGDVSHHLRPIVLERAGLLPAIRQLCNDVGTASRIEVRFSGQGLKNHISWTTSLCLYRITQEALRNINRHAHASRADIRINEGANWITLRVCDDGVGYDPGKLRPEAGLGVTSMKDHVASVGGILTVKAAPGQGTKITVRLPVQTGK